MALSLVAGRQVELTAVAATGAAAVIALAAARLGGLQLGGAPWLPIAGLAAILLVREPRWALLAAALYLPFDSSTLGLHDLPLGLSTAKILGAVTALALAYAVAIRGARLRLFDSALDYAAIAYVTLVLATSCVGEHPALDLLGRLPLLLAFYFAVKNLAAQTAAFRAVAWAVVLGGAASSLAGVLLQLSRSPGGEASRFGGVFMDPNYFAAAATVALVLAAALAMDPATRWRWQRAAAAAAAGLLATAIVLTGSRAGLLTAAVALLLVILRQRHRWRLLAAAVTVLALSLPFWPVETRERIAATLDHRTAIPGDPPEAQAARSSTERRLAYLEVGLDAIARRPLAGYGYLGFAPLFAASDFVRFDNPLEAGQRLRAAHDTYLEIAVGSGLIALAAYVAMLGLAWSRLRRSRLRGGELAAITGGFELALVSLALSNLFLSIDAFKVSWLVIALAAALPDPGPTPTPPPAAEAATAEPDATRRHGV